MGTILNRTKAVERLVQLPECKAKDIGFVLPIACRHGNLTLAKILLEKFPKELFTRDNIKSPLLVAVKRGNAKLVETVLRYLPTELVGDAKNLNAAMKKGFLGIADILLWAGKTSLASPPHGFQERC